VGQAGGVQVPDDSGPSEGAASEGDPRSAPDPGGIRAEIVIGLVGALGTPLQTLQRAVDDALAAVGYKTSALRVSELIRVACDEYRIDAPPAATHVGMLMDLGDAFREAVNNGAAAVALGVMEIAADRRRWLEDHPSDEREGWATIIRQLKRPEEVRLLRSIYGPRFVLIGGWSPQEEREKEIRLLLQRENYGESAGWYADHVTELLARDEKDANRPFGQRVRDTFELADAYFALLPGRDITPEVTRLVRLLFGAPFETPSSLEQAMYQAAGARLRSADAGRQVGAVVMDAEGEVIVTGVNEVPKAGGGQYWASDEPDHREFKRGYDENEFQKLALINDVLRSLQGAGWLSDSKRTTSVSLLAMEAVSDGGPLAKSRVGDLLEFGRVAHAEMAAICTAARRGTPIGGATLVSTTYPCHECARLIIASGLRRVVYVDPYPKSQVPAMYHHEIVEGPTNDSGGRVIFEPFEGVAPRLYPRVFAMLNRGRDVSGRFEEWEPRVARPRLVQDADILPPVGGMEDEALGQFFEALEALVPEEDVGT
jgi:cytidine deaminase